MSTILFGDRMGTVRFIIFFLGIWALGNNRASPKVLVGRRGHRSGLRGVVAPHKQFPVKLPKSGLRRKKNPFQKSCIGRWQINRGYPPCLPYLAMSERSGEMRSLGGHCP